MHSSKLFTLKNLAADIPAGLVTALVALPLCLGIALASGAPLFSGILAGIIGGIIVGIISGSSNSVSGPAAGLAAIVVTQIEALGSFDKFLLATFFSGMIQIGIGLAKAGFLAAFFPSSVVKGLLAAIGILLILKQLPHIVGHDPDPLGDLAFEQPDHQNTFSDIWLSIWDFQPAAMIIGFASLSLLLTWEKLPALKKLRIPAPVVVVILALALHAALGSINPTWILGGDHMVQVPVLSHASEITTLLTFPDFSAWNHPQLFVTALTLAIVASLETLLNLDAADSLDPRQRKSPPNRELIAQGIGNMLGGLIGALPTTSVVVRSSVNIQAGNASKLSTIFHGILLALCVLLAPQLLNLIPLSALAAILIVTGFKLANPTVFKKMWREGSAQFYPFVFTVFAIIFTDLLKGIVAGLVVSVAFILRSNFRQPVRMILEKHITGDVTRIELREQVSFLNRAALETTIEQLPAGGNVVLDASRSNFIDPDVIHLISNFVEETAPARGIKVTLLGFKTNYPQLSSDEHFIDYSTRELQKQLTPDQVLGLLKAGNERFVSGQRLNRDWTRQIAETAKGQAPLAVVLGCIDSRNSSELIFDSGIGDIFSVRLAGNVAKRKAIGSMEYSCAVAGAKLIIVMGHTACGAVTSAVKSYGDPDSIVAATGCEHINSFLGPIQEAIDPTDPIPGPDQAAALSNYVDGVALRHVQLTIEQILNQSHAIAKLVAAGEVAIIGALYDVSTGIVDFCAAEGPLAEALNTQSRAALPAPSSPSRAGQFQPSRAAAS